MDLVAIQNELSNIWIGLVALAFFDCLFILLGGIAMAWSVALVNRVAEERQILLENRYKEDRGEFLLLVQTVKRIAERMEALHENDNVS